VTRPGISERRKVEIKKVLVVMVSTDVNCQGKEPEPEVLTEAAASSGPRREAREDGTVTVAPSDAEAKPRREKKRQKRKEVKTNMCR
jgi:hypothetical protein